MDDSWDIPGPRLCAQPCEHEACIPSGCLLSALGVQPGKQLLGEALGKRTPVKGAGSKAQSATSLSDLVLEEEEGGVRRHENSPGSFWAVLNGFHFMERNGLVSMQSPFSDPFCHNIFLIVFSITIF